MPKFVVSSTLEGAEWNNSKIITGNMPEEVAKIKQQTNGNIGITGSTTLPGPTPRMPEFPILSTGGRLVPPSIHIIRGDKS
jgi:hypothetical protein